MLGKLKRRTKQEGREKMQYPRREASVRLQMMLNSRLFERGKISKALYTQAQERLQNELTIAIPEPIIKG